MISDIELTIKRLNMQHTWLSQSGQFIAAETLQADIKRLELVLVELKQVEVLNEDK